MTRALLASLLLAGCYDPGILDGLPCSESHQCPAGQSCLPGPELCFVEAPPQAVFQQISSGAAHTCAISPVDELYCWGGNRGGELGLGDTLTRAVPTRVDTPPGWASVATGNLFTVAVRDGELYGWGESDYVVSGPRVPTVIEPGSSWERVVAGDRGWCALEGDGTLLCRDRGTLVEPDGMPDGWDDAAIAGAHYCGIRAGALYCWGEGSSGQLGDGQMTTALDPIEIEPDTTWIAIAAGTTHTCAVDDAGDVWCWGDNSSGQCAQPDLFEDFPNPVRVPGVEDIVTIRSGWDTTCASQGGGATWCWGAGAHGQLGDNRAERHATMPTGMVVTPMSTMSVGLEHGCGLDFGGGGWCWGNDADGQLGDGDLGRVMEPTVADDSRRWLGVSVGERHACAIAEADLTGWCWGKNGRGQLGDGTDLRRVTPAAIDDPVDQGWLALSAGWDHTCGIRPNYTLWCWGAADRGQLGLGEGSDLQQPAQVGDRQYVEVAAGDGGTCAIDDEGALWCWGGARGTTPVAVATGNTWSALARGTGGDQCAVQDGRPWCWSLDTTTDPVALSGDLGLDGLARGADHTCGVSEAMGGAMRCIGQDSQGELGDGTDVMPDTPVTPTIADGWSHVAAGNQFTCGLQDGGALYCWGWNGFGQLGDGSLQGRDAPAPNDAGPFVELSVAGNSACAIEIEFRSLYCWGTDHGRAGGWDVPSFVVAP